MPTFEIDLICRSQLLRIDLPWIETLVKLSLKVLFLTSIKRSNFLSKSEPIMGDCTSAITKIQVIGRRRPKFKVTDLLPYVLIFEPFAANRLNKHGAFLRCWREDGNVVPSVDEKISAARFFFDEKAIYAWPVVKCREA